jgi:8-amino-7-oxononanoate synthase
MLDFTSALYLGFEHASWNLPGWPRLTLGKPGALEALPGTVQAQEKLAALTGCEQVLPGSSTLHLFCDLFAILATRNVAIWVDEAAYPIARWGSDRAAAAGVCVRTFPAHDGAALRKVLDGRRHGMPVIVTDGFCPIRGRPAPLGEYAESAERAGGLLIVDDTQALGVLGGQPSCLNPYGIGGGGSMRLWNLHHPGIVVVSSLAKAFGVPMAMIGGARPLMNEFRENSASLVHSSPPSAASIAAALHALEMNGHWGDSLRRRLATRIARFRRAVPDLVATGSLFPVQPLKFPAHVDARALHATLAGQGVRSILHRDPGDGRPRISFVFSAHHGIEEIDQAARILLSAVANNLGKTKGVGGNVSRTR